MTNVQRSLDVYRESTRRTAPERLAPAILDRLGLADRYRLLDSEIGPVMAKLIQGGIEITAVHNHVLRANPATFYMHIGGHGDPVALAQPDELALVFRNLIDNAVKYSGAAIDVRVSARTADDGQVRVVIEDRGVGIPREELRRIFLPFYRAGLDVQRRVKGLGLGLFIVRYLVRRQGGRVAARSEGPGRGSRFEVSLRAAVPPTALPAALEPHAQRPGR